MFGLVMLFIPLVFLILTLLLSFFGGKTKHRLQNCVDCFIDDSYMIIFPIYLLECVVMLVVKLLSFNLPPACNFTLSWSEVGFFSFLYFLTALGIVLLRDEIKDKQER